MDLMVALDKLEDLRRTALFRATAAVESEQAAGLLFGVGLVVTDHVFNILRKVLP